MVEDNETVRNVAVRILNGLGYKTLVARDGEEAMKIFKSQNSQIDLVMMDVVMPKESGPETYKKMSVLKPDLPVMFVTGYDIEQKMQEFGQDQDQTSYTLLQKPYTKNTLGQKVQKLLQQRK